MLHGAMLDFNPLEKVSLLPPCTTARRYPVILNKFLINTGTGGEGRFKGGDGVLREMLFRSPLTLSVLSERRVYCPYGLEGGNPGSVGRNTVVRKNGTVLDIGGKASVEMYPGVCCV